MPEMKDSSDPRVSFRRPDWKDIADSGRSCVDMHFHTNCSDSFTDVHEMLALAKERHTGVAVTDHNLISSLEVLDNTDHDILVIPGMEVSTADGPHILVYFYEYRDLKQFWMKNIRPNLRSCPWLALEDITVEKLLDCLEGESCVVSAAHPMGYLGTNKGAEVCCRKGYLSDETVERMNAYEVICGGMTRTGNRNALEAAKRHGLGFTGGSDGHILTDLGNVVTVSDATDVSGVLDSILGKRNLVVGTEKKLPKKVRTGAASTARFAYHAPSATHVQIKQAGMSAKRGLEKIEEDVERRIRSK